MARRRRDPIADAHQQVRALRNKIHSLEQEMVAPLRLQVANLQRDYESLQHQLGADQELLRLYRAAWESTLRLISGLASGKI